MTITEFQQPERPGFTYIIAPRIRVAVDLARSLGLPPYGRAVVLVTHGDSLRGRTLTEADRVVWADQADGWSPRQIAYLQEQLQIAQCTMTRRPELTGGQNSRG